MTDADTCYRAMCARDRRFDGVFFVAVHTTGVYCRPICPARTPARDRCAFYRRAAEAERAGFRACFRCRPELAPGLAPVDSVPRLVRAAAARVGAGFLDQASVDDLGRELGVTARHLRRAMEAEMGVSPIELAQSRRLALAKQLLQDTKLPLTTVAFASGFSSLRRFNALFRERFGRPPSAVRRSEGTGGDGSSHGGGRGPRRMFDVVSLRLDYRPPLDTAALFSFLGARAIPGVERVQDGELQRTVRIGDVVGWVAVRPDDARPALRARVSVSLAPRLADVVSRLRALFDLDAQPHVIAEALGGDTRLGPLVARHPGLRVPGAFDAFETACRTVLGQQVSVRAATTLAGRLARTLGRPARRGTGSPPEAIGEGTGSPPEAFEEGTGSPPEASEDGLDGLDRFFPTAAELARVPASRVQAIGLPGARARTLVALARAVAGGRLDLGPSTDPEAAIAALEALPGIGPWTAQAIAMRVLHWPDAFVAGDLAVRAALGNGTARETEALSAAWRPWRAYAVLHLWTSLSTQAGG